MHPILSDSVFFHLFEKKVENVPKFCTYGCFKKWLKKTKKKKKKRQQQLTDPKIQKSHFRATQQFPFFGLMDRVWFCHSK